MPTEDVSLYSILEAMPHPVFIKDTQHCWVGMNAKLCALFGQSRETLLGKNETDFMPVRQAELLWKTENEVLETGQDRHTEETFILPHAQSNAWFLLQQSIYELEGIPHVLGVLIDITEKKKIEQRLRLQADILNLIAEGKTPFTEILNMLCRLVERLVNGALCSVMEPKIIHNNDLYVLAAPSIPEHLCTLLNGLNIGVGNGSCGTAAYTRKAEYVSNTRSDSRWNNLHHMIDELGVQSCWSHPILDSNGVVFGTFAISQLEPKTPTATDRDLLETAAQLAQILFTRRESKRKEAEQHAALAYSEERYQTLAHVAPVGLFHATADGQCWYVNQRWCQLSGLSFEKIQGNGWLHALHPDDHEWVANRWHSCIKHHQTFEEEYRFIHANQQVVWVLGRSAPEFDDQGHLSGWILSNTDISDRKKIEQSVRDNEYTLRQFYSIISNQHASSIDALLRFACDTFFMQHGALFVMDKYAKLIPYTSSYQNDSANPPSEDFLNALQKDILKQGANGEPIVFEDFNDNNLQVYPYRHATGCCLGCVIHYGKQRAILIFTGTQTSRNFYRHELQLMELISQWISTVLLRKHTEKELQQAQKLEAIGQLASGVAHDFNNLLTVIGGNVKYIQDILFADINDPEFTEIMDETNSVVEQAEVLTRGMLGLSRRHDMHLSSTDVASSVQKIAAICQKLFPENIQIEVDCSGCFPAMTDHNFLQNALLNLALNARDAMRQNTLTTETNYLRINVRLKQLDADFFAQQPRIDIGEAKQGNYIEILVGDTGVGMNEKVRQCIFEPLFSARTGRGGTGLGLFMVREFILRSQGFIQVESRQNEGTCFHLFLPHVQQTVEKNNDKIPINMNQLRGSGHILVIDDEVQLRTSLVRQLRSLGYTVSEAENADQAWRLLQKHTLPDAVLSDIIMTGAWSGIDLASHMLQQYAEIPLILMTASEQAYEEAEKRFVDTGIQLLKKPFAAHSPAYLLAQILQHEKVSEL